MSPVRNLIIHKVVIILLGEATYISVDLKQRLGGFITG